MIILIPIALFATVSLILLLTFINDDIEDHIARSERSRDAITLHHQVVTEQRFFDNGLINNPVSGVFSAFSGVQSYSFSDGDTVYVVTFVSDHEESSDSPDEDQDRMIRASMRKSLTDIEKTQEFRWNVSYGDFTRLIGTFPAAIGDINIPFVPPLQDGAPVILSIFTEDTP